MPASIKNEDRACDALGWTAGGGRHACRASYALVNTPQIADAIEKGVNTFMEAVPALMKVLDEVAKVHPFISGMCESVLNACAPIDDS
jgi:hypothetical protein